MNNVANHYFSQKLANKALQHYNLAIQNCQITNCNDAKYLAMLRNNRATCFLSMGDYESAKSDCDASILYDAGRLKAYWTRAKIYQHWTDYVKAVEDLQKVIMINPNSKIARHKLSQVEILKRYQLRDRRRFLCNCILWFIGMSLDDFINVGTTPDGWHIIRFSPQFLIRIHGTRFEWIILCLEDYIQSIVVLISMLLMDQILACVLNYVCDNPSTSIVKNFCHW